MMERVTDMSTEPSSENNPSEEALGDERLRADVGELLRRVDALATLNSRTADEILGYDEHGLPT